MVFAGPHLCKECVSYRMNVPRTQGQNQIVLFHGLHEEVDDSRSVLDIKNTFVPVFLDPIGDDSGIDMFDRPFTG